MIRAIAKVGYHMKRLKKKNRTKNNEMFEMLPSAPPPAKPIPVQRLYIKYDHCCTIYHSFIRQRIEMWRSG